jgi:phosphate transport system substrate-binding protein
LGLLALPLALASFVGCPSRSAGPVTTLQIDGSSTLYPITEAVAEEFRPDHPNVRITVGLSGTGAGFKKFYTGTIEICDASRPIKDAEIEACKANGIEYVEFKVAYDGLSVIVNPENTWCDCLTVEQLKQLWQPESTVNKWSDLDPMWPNERIQLYGPGTDSGTFEYFTEVIVGKSKSSRSDYSRSEDDNVLVTGVAGDKFALGYFGFAYYEENKSRLKLLGVKDGDGECVKPSLETVRENSYKPLSRPLYIYVAKTALARPEVREFMTFYLENAGKLAGEVGYVPLPDAERQASRGKLEEVLAEINPSEKKA